MASPHVSSTVKLPPFQSLLDDHGRDVHRFLIATVGAGAAEDCYQETWLAALRAYPQLRDASNLRGWIFTVAHRKAIDHARRQQRQPVPIGELPERPGPSAEDPDEELWAQVLELPRKQRAAIALRFLADAGYAEVSGVMGTTEEAARRNVHEGLKRLRREYRR